MGIQENQKREAKRLEAVQKEAAAKAARASKPWAKEELAAVVKAVKKYPAGGANRWETIALFVNNLCKLDDLRTKEQCIEKFNQVTAANKTTTGSNTSSSSSSTNQESSKSSPHKSNKQKGGGGANKIIQAAEWSEEQVKKLQAGLSKFPAKMEKNERWAAIAKCVPGKTKKECVQRFKAIRVALKNK